MNYSNQILDQLKAASTMSLSDSTAGFFLKTLVDELGQLIQDQKIVELAVSSMDVSIDNSANRDFLVEAAKHFAIIYYDHYQFCVETFPHTTDQSFLNMVGKITFRCE